MQLDLTRFRQPVSHVSRRFAPEEVDPEGGESYRVVGPVDLEFDLHKDKNRFRVVGRVQAELELPCSRCLEPYRMPIDAAFDLRYLPASEGAGGDEREVADEDLDTSVYRDDQIDLNEVLREQFYLALPMKPLCRADCAGLCPRCGTNRNTGTCSCATEWEDPRLAPLKGLKGVSSLRSSVSGKPEDRKDRP
jgi:uncharacterized protein